MFSCLLHASGSPLGCIRRVLAYLRLRRPAHLAEREVGSSKARYRVAASNALDRKSKSRRPLREIGGNRAYPLFAAAEGCFDA
jgi:hypothetical protein